MLDIQVEECGRHSLKKEYNKNSSHIVEVTKAFGQIDSNFVLHLRWDYSA